MDREVIAQKLESLRRCLKRVEEKCPSDSDTLAREPDLQDIITLNLTRAVQLCVDIGSHVIAEMEVSPPNTMGETFDILAQDHENPRPVRRKDVEIGLGIGAPDLDIQRAGEISPPTFALFQRFPGARGVHGRRAGDYRYRHPQMIRPGMAAVAALHDDADRHGLDPILLLFAQGAPLEISDMTQTLVPRRGKASGNIGDGRAAPLGNPRTNR